MSRSMVALDKGMFVAPRQFAARRDCGLLGRRT
jgi:hypothetical protein